jgi:long-chain acyl-CoA synthetase
MVNLAVILEESVRRHPDREAVVFGEHRLTYRQLAAAVNRVASGLAANGIKPGDKVALSCPNLPYFPVAYFGILKAGATVVPLNVLFKRREIAYHLSDSDARAYLCFQGTPELPMAQEGWAGFEAAERCETFFVITADPAGASPIDGAPTLGALMAAGTDEFAMERRSPMDTAVILYTSGTTGTPKGAELTHFNLMMNTLANRDMLQTTADDTYLVTLPLFHSFGQVVQMTTGVFAGVKQVLLARFDPDDAFAAMQKEGVTFFAGVPTMYWALLNHPDAERYDLEGIARNLRLAVSGGAALPVQVLHDFEERFSVPILEGYGLSETSPVASFNQLEWERKPGSIGRPIWGVEMAIFDDEGREVAPGERGEVVIRGHNIMKGYYKRPEANAEALRNGWFHSGDVGVKDEDGYFYIVDRTKDMVIRGGFNVYPREVEEVMMSHPEISLAAVIGVPHEQHGEEIKAFVVLADGSDLTADEIVAWAKDTIAAYKYPRVVEIRDSLPMTATGKILKTELRENSGEPREESLDGH